MVKTKIIATVGPASSAEAMLRKMFTAGLDMIRLNFSHGELVEHLGQIELVRSLNKKMRRHVKIMQDLEGNRVRVGKLSEPVLLKKGALLYLVQENVTGNEKEIPFDYLGSLKPVKKRTLVYIDDGKIVLRVVEPGKSHLKVRVVTGGMLYQHKGMNIPSAELDFEELTAKDRTDLNVAIDQRLDYLAQSFVRGPGDIRVLKDIVKPKHPGCRIFAKIENKEAVDSIDDIIEASDGIMVARGDLGICVPIYKVPVIQKEIIKKCRAVNKPVIVATQMLDSMTEELIPTRAEVSDVANAILDGASHCMLSAETTIGRHPHKVVDMMNRIIKYTEDYQSKEIVKQEISKDN